MEMDQTVPASNVRVEFQAIILAGGAGNRLYPLSEGVPKPLLPIANRPLLCYQLELLERSGKFAGGCTMRAICLCVLLCTLFHLNLRLDSVAL